MTTKKDQDTPQVPASHKNPVVSVCLPTYNGARFVKPAMESILRQSFADFELLISDDCSADETQEIVLSQSDPRIRSFHNTSRLGLVGNWNRCIELARGEYVYIFHQDDLMEKDVVQRGVRLLNQHPKVGFVFSDIVTIDAEGKTIGRHWTPILPERDTIFPEQDFFRLLAMNGNLVPCQTVMARAECFRRFGKFDARLRYTPDLEMWLRLALHYDVGYIAEPLVKLRRHPGQASCDFMAQTEEAVEVWRCFKIVFTEQVENIVEPERAFGLVLTHLRQWEVGFFKQSVKQGDIRSALLYLEMLCSLVYHGQCGVRSLSPLTI